MTAPVPSKATQTKTRTPTTSGVDAKLLQRYLDHSKVIYSKTFADSSIKDDSANYPKFGLDELVIGKVLGKGGFGTVSEVRDVSMSTSLDQKPTPSESRPSLVVKAISSRSASMKIPDKETDQGEVESRNFIAKHCIRNGGDARYAIKVLSPEVLQDPGRLCQGIVDMAVETRVLSSILHPNIVKMRALGASQNGEDGMFQPSYFILMDRLYDTLEKRLQKWQTRFNRTSGLAGRMTDRKGLKSAALYEERIVAAFDLSAALTYLHEQQILYRDLKPENIGFDIRDDIKIFDFGLAKELCEKDRNPDGTYNLTGLTGSPRYMCPNVANSKPYNASCDVYSFGILLWEILALRTPYELYTPKSLREKVYNGPCKRPPVDPAWNNSMKILLKRCWEQDLHERVSMDHACSILRKEAASVRDGDESGLEHVRRRSTFVFRPSKVNAKKGI